MKQILAKFLKIVQCSIKKCSILTDEDAATMAEYALLVALLVLAAAGTTGTFRKALKSFYRSVTSWRTGLKGMGP